MIKTIGNVDVTATWDEVGKSHRLRGIYSGFDRESYLPTSCETSDHDFQRQGAALRWKADFVREEGAPSYHRILKAEAYAKRHATKHANTDG